MGSRLGRSSIVWQFFGKAIEVDNLTKCWGISFQMMNYMCHLANPTRVHLFVHNTSSCVLF